MESKNGFKGLVLKIMHVIILIIHWELLILILETFYQTEKKIRKYFNLEFYI